MWHCSISIEDGVTMDKNYLVAPRSHVSQRMREARQGHKGMVFWLTGLSGAGKSTLAHAVEERLFHEGVSVITFDGDAIRTGLCKDLSFSSADRRENNRRIAEVARLFALNGTVCLCAFISPARDFRLMAAEIIGDELFREVFIDCSLQECERRDEKGFYRKARQGVIRDYTGVSSSYEAPESPACRICTEHSPVEANVEELLAFVRRNVRS